MKIKKTEFIKSSTSIKECPIKGLPEFVFYGRSNVGKSSLINMITNNQKLSKISSKPGKTQLINHFLINGNFYLVDLPGYGWAKTSKENREKWDVMCKNFLIQSKKLALLFLLIDVRLKPQKIDIENVNYLGKNGIPINLIFTKCDKVGKEELKKNINLFNSELLNSWKNSPDYFISSSVKKIGIDSILGQINKTIISINNV
jgi:GTP-binding protein